MCRVLESELCAGSLEDEDPLAAELAAEREQGKLFSSRSRSESFTRSAPLSSTCHRCRCVCTDHADGLHLLPRGVSDPAPQQAPLLKTAWPCSGEDLEQAELQLRHFSYHAFEGGSGQLRWTHQASLSCSTMLAVTLRGIVRSSLAVTPSVHAFLWHAD